MPGLERPKKYEFIWKLSSSVKRLRKTKTHSDTDIIKSKLLTSYAVFFNVMSKLTDFSVRADKNSMLNLPGKIKVKLVLFFTLSVTFLIFAQLVFAGNLAVNGQKVASIEKEIQELEIENTALKVEIAEDTSLSNLSLKADKLGFQKPLKIVKAN